MKKTFFWIVNHVAHEFRTASDERTRPGNEATAIPLFQQQSVHAKMMKFHSCLPVLHVFKCIRSCWSISCMNFILQVMNMQGLGTRLGLLASLCSAVSLINLLYWVRLICWRWVSLCSFMFGVFLAWILPIYSAVYIHYPIYHSIYYFR